MIGAGISYYNENAPENYLDGPSKVYDGSFDYDRVGAFLVPPSTSPFTVLITLNLTAINRLQRTFRAIGGGNVGFEITILDTNFIDFGVYVAFPINALLMRTTTTIATGRQTLIFTYDGSRTLAGINAYRNGVLFGKTALFNSLGVRGAVTLDAFIGSNGSASELLNSNIRQLEIINRVATPAEIASASTSGSFRGAGITHASGEYLLAIDTDKVNGQNLTTFSGTPSYAMTAFGGATYTPYL